MYKKMMFVLLTLISPQFLVDAVAETLVPATRWEAIDLTRAIPALNLDKCKFRLTLATKIDVKSKLPQAADTLRYYSTKTWSTVTTFQGVSQGTSQTIYFDEPLGPALMYAGGALSTEDAIRVFSSGTSLKFSLNLNYSPFNPQVSSGQALYLINGRSWVPSEYVVTYPKLSAFAFEKLCIP